ncbi:hypothetical protein [Planctomyces sp. SH-PL62]|uniref:hypothetical protein n=1 Tax=Planctomyces sp. SH-PL62 TaxID=1636152 RepID=UPI00078E05C5|nr:hypothetical protein [Planctomyces sp. SH-PL62]AMV38838.1 hypothetical protein VT85_15490 [Planctomyces sp. SH-PL62]
MTTSAYRNRRRERRGVILILVLGVLGLMAVIGVTFATFTGQSRIASRSFAQSKIQPQSEQLMEFALSQLISDTNDVRSAIRGHSLARDMFGNDAGKNGYLDARPDGARTAPGNNSFFYVTRIVAGALPGQYILNTNIPEGDPLFYGYNFLRWTIRVGYVGSPPPTGVTGAINQTFEVVGDGGFVAGSTNPRQLTVVIAPTDVSTNLRNLNNISTTFPTGTNTVTPASRLVPNLNATFSTQFRFILDGRWLHAFNGPGKSTKAKYANFRYNLDMPGAVGMDEDYDAVDLENWFLAMQSADGQVIIPSFHRPANLRYEPGVLNDWEDLPADTAVVRREKISRLLRPRQADGHDPVAFPDLIPDATTGQITFDVDNDGDGVSDSVWVDLGYPARRNAQGTLYKPLFAFMVVGLNGRIPLNTAGNLAGRGTGEESNATHASHLGNSVSEIDPTYGLQNALYPGYGQADSSTLDVRLTQLRNILAGTRPQADPKKPDMTGQVNGDVNLVQMGWQDTAQTIPIYTSMPNGITDVGDVDSAGNTPPTAPVVRKTNPVAGRWGEPESVPGGQYTPLGTNYSNEVRPGYSISIYDYFGGGGVPADAADDDFNSFDVYPTASITPPRVGEINDADFYDPAGALLLPVERMRRFLTPVDLNGSGSVSRWNSRGGARSGADYWGRVEYRGYYRPPGLPGLIDPANGQILYPWASGDTYPNAMPSSANVTNRLAHNNNILHGYESFLNPNARGAPQRAGGILAYQDSTATPPLAIGAPTKMPTYNGEINSGLQYTYNDVDETGTPISVTVNSRSDGLNEADELNLYNPNPNLDSPFSHADLEWLYRRQDADGASLGSRLASLAPISFLNDQDGLRRRRLYAIESWESNAYAWANDNPVDALNNPLFPSNSRFASGANANMANISATTSTPALAQRGRKINLNMPLPVSNDPNEPIRRKWITDAYQLMKTVLPPRAVDTPEELAQLGQYLVNLVDFRDPDCTMTRWVNPDVFLVPVGRMTPVNALPVLSFTNPSGAVPLEQFGMEFNPIAINEVLAYSYARKEGVGPGVNTGRFFVELVNTLTRPETGERLPRYPGDPFNNASQVNLSGFNSTAAAPYDGACWDLIFTEDLPGSRPEPFSGQLQPGAVVHSLTPLSRAAFTPAADAVLNPLPRQKGGSAADFFGSATDPKYIATIANAFPGTGTEADSETKPVAANLPGTANLFTLATAYDPVNPTAAPTLTLPAGVLPKTITGAPVTVIPPKITRIAGQATYYWVCLRRPANPMAPVSANNPMIVVDSMRFPYIDAGGTVRTDSTPNPTTDPNRVDLVSAKGDNDIYSYQRMQPYRGGQAVPVIGATTGNIDPRYGYTEQIAAPITTLGGMINYGTGTTQQDGSLGPQVSRGTIYHTLGLPNDGTIAGANPAEYWDFFPFHDRDFTSPFELTLVPGVGPGMFTKHFAEFAPTASNESGFKAAAAGTLATTRSGLVRPILVTGAGSPCASDQLAQLLLYRGASSPVEPHTYPYLVDKFFYTAAGASGITDTLYTSPTAAATVGGYAGDGWFKMFEFFEVPSQMAGAIGSVAQGTNFDWARQDLKAGLMNLNLIIDEEAFLALLGKQDMSGSPPTFQQRLMNPYMLPLPSDFSPAYSGFTGGLWSGPLTTGHPTTPIIVSAITADGSPAYAYPMQNVGTVAPEPDSTSLQNRMKAAFAQFLWTRHGGSGFLFGFGEGATGQNMAISLPTPPTPAAPFNATFLTQIPAERPFRSLSYPDIGATPMRPAALPPSGYTDPVFDSANPWVSFDPGFRSLLRFPGFDRLVGPISTAAATVLPPPIPTRRLFQLPDAFTGTSMSNASVLGSPYINRLSPVGAGNPAIGAMPPILMASDNLARNINDGAINLFIPDTNTPATYDNVDHGRGGANPNLTQHPYFRSELMQRVLNLTTVRTHQYAVWITVGFFEVKREGDIAMIGSAYPQAAFDVLGPEIGASTAENTRYRSFFVVDRLKLTGFDPESVGAFRPAVVYRRTIE